MSMLRPAPNLFIATTVLLLVTFDWAKAWLFSGAPVLTYVVLLGDGTGSRIFPSVNLWALVATFQLTYAVAATSWLLYWVFTAACLPLVFALCLSQSRTLADGVRASLRKLLKQFQFTSDKIGFFDIPALEIDTEVDGLMVIRGLTISLSSLTITAHDVEVGIKLSDDMELALQTEKVTISLFRSIEIGDVFANLKGGQYEMTFGDLAEKTQDENGNALMVADTPLLKAAAAGDGMVKMTERMTDSKAPEATSPQQGLESMTHISPDDDGSRASRFYEQTLQQIRETSALSQSRKMASERLTGDKNRNDYRAATCSQLHTRPSVPHPPRKAIKVTTLQTLAPPYIRRFLHRLPMLLRLLLNPLSYFHPITISAITAAASGQWIEQLLKDKIFKHYAEESSEVMVLQKKVLSWLSDANFSVCLEDIAAYGHVPFFPKYDIINHLAFKDVMVYRTLPKGVDLKQIVRVGGADATIVVPSFLLPHHEHLLPPKPSVRDEISQARHREHVEGQPKTVQAEKELEQIRKDETNVKISVHARLPACLDQDLLNFVSALVKASKVVELEKDPSPLDEEVHGLKDFSRALGQSLKDSVKKTAINAAANDRWIAKLVGKVTKKLETALGEVGYSGDIPVALQIYRDHAESASKLLG